ncbi:uncharacterized protein Triagg1_3474 [Trichoderma aggressivum f. europaeum]|uniref:AAA+ ATPase domain-containing protein n=1 Tax=Trichoderma aggressivum f. europaeum TaxID=173218 RepID=A0AAE1IJ08_9HYPO|nr:hypothetical protein Triagg1_3474 [Trichoderma aggressivum f. europaeum]
MSQPNGQADLVPKVTDIRPLPFRSPEPPQHSMDEISVQGGVIIDNTEEHRIISDESAPQSSTTDNPQVLQDVASPESPSDAGWMVSDKEAVDSDKDTIENMSLGDFQMREETPEPAISNPLEAYGLQLMRLEPQGKTPLTPARPEQPESGIKLLQQDYALRFKLLEEQTKTRLIMARQEQPEPATSSTQPDYDLQLRLLEVQNKRRLDMARQEQYKFRTPPPHLDTQRDESSEMNGQEQPQPANRLALQDYGSQLMLLEAQNKKRLQMARQKQSPLDIQPPQTQMKMKGPPGPHVMAVMPPTQGNATAGSGNMMATLPPGARYFIPASPANPAAMNVKIMPNSGAQPTTLPMSPSPPDPAILALQGQLRDLVITNQVLRRQLNDAKGVNFAIFHCIVGQEEEGTYLEKPHWTKSGEKLQLKAYAPLLYPDAYILYKPLAFVIYKYYSPDMSTEASEILQQGGEMPGPEPTREVIKLLSDDMIKAVELFEKEDEEAQKKLPCLSVEKEMSAPYLWWYHYRDNRNRISNLPKPEAELVHLLTNWIDANYSELYDQIDSQFKRGAVSATSLPFLVQPGDVLVRWDAEGVEAFLAMSWLHKKKKNSEIQEHLEDSDWTFLSAPWSKKFESWEVDAWSYVYSGNFYRVVGRLDINLDVDEAGTEIPIVNLNVFPLRFASQELRERLERRGKIFWNCGYGNYISYDNQNKNEEHAQEECYMIDCRVYYESTPNQRATPEENASIREFKVESRFIPGEESPSEPDVYLFPRTIIGYHLQRKEWNRLNVDQIQEMPWNEKAFSNIAEDVEIEELVRALVATKIAAQVRTDAIHKKGDTLITVLHGGPGTGKTFTTKSIAELAEKRLLEVKCSKPDITAKRLNSMFYLAGLWGALLMIEDAEALQEQRPLDGPPRDSFVSDLLREIERYDGIIVFTSKSAGDLEELLKSRSRLSVPYEALTQPRRAQIWRNFLSHIDSRGEKNIDFDGIHTHMGELSERVMSEHQICSAITTAWQLAQFQGKMMTIGHLRCVNSFADEHIPFS